MHYLVCSDLHGGDQELSIVLKYFEQYSCNALVLLGDLLAYGGYGSGIGLWQKAVPKIVAMLNEYKDHIIAVRGNCDQSNNCQMFDFDCSAYVREFFIYQNNQSNQGLDSQTHDNLLKQRVLLTHGHYLSEDCSGFYHKQGQALVDQEPLKSGDIILSGHTHVAGIFVKRNGLINVNPGSIHLPRGGSQAGFALLLEDHLELRTLKNECIGTLSFNFQ